MQTILIADDEADIRALINETLTDEGFACIEASDGDQVIQYVSQGLGIDLILLDVMMPGKTGFQVCEIIRPMTNAPILLLTAKVKEMDKVVGLTVGADDYITKPFGIAELIARVRAHLRREHRNRSMPQMATEWRNFGNVRINFKTMEAFCEDQFIKLSSKEFKILEYLFDNENIVLNREQILDAVWGYQEFADVNIVTVHIKNLRQKIDPNSRHILTIWGMGYKFVC